LGGPNRLRVRSPLRKSRLSSLQQGIMLLISRRRPPGSIPTLTVGEFSHGTPNSSAAENWSSESQSVSSHSNDVPQMPSHRASTSPAISAIIDQDISNYILEPCSGVETNTELVLSPNPSPVQLPDESLSGSPRPFGGILSSINTLYSLPIKQTTRNAELLHFCM
jgi:hypothetical protein